MKRTPLCLVAIATVLLFGCMNHPVTIRTLPAEQTFALRYFTLETLSHLPTNAPFRVISKSEAPVLQRGRPGEWDSVDLLNPSIIRKGGILFNYYSGFDGTSWRTGLATSLDGIHWTKYAQNPILDLTSHGWD